MRFSDYIAGYSKVYSEACVMLQLSDVACQEGT